MFLSPLGTQQGTCRSVWEVARNLQRELDQCQEQRARLLSAHRDIVWCCLPLVSPLAPTLCTLLFCPSQSWACFKIITRGQYPLEKCNLAIQPYVNRFLLLSFSLCFGISDLEALGWSRERPAVNHFSLPPILARLKIESQQSSPCYLFVLAMAKKLPDTWNSASTTKVGENLSVTPETVHVSTLP